MAARRLSGGDGDTASAGGTRLSDLVRPRFVEALLSRCTGSEGIANHDMTIGHHDRQSLIYRHSFLVLTPTHSFSIQQRTTFSLFRRHLIIDGISQILLNEGSYRFGRQLAVKIRGIT
jgi:hypothetical protein